MPQSLPYLPSYKNVSKLFEKILSAKTPDVFNSPFLTDILGLKGTGDRPLIPLLKTLGFLDGSGKPDKSYDLLKNKGTAGVAIAEATRKAYAPLFSANINANELSPSDLRGVVAQVSGVDDQTVSKILGTFNALVKNSNFSVNPVHGPNLKIKKEEEEEASEMTGKSLRPEFHYNIQVHLPSNGTEETYLNIFNALRKTLQ